MCHSSPPKFVCIFFLIIIYFIHFDGWRLLFHRTNNDHRSICFSFILYFFFGSVCYRNASLCVVAAGADVLLVACSLALIPHFIFGRGKKSSIVFAFCVHVACPGTCRTEYSFLLCWRALCCAIYAS